MGNGLGYGRHFKSGIEDGFLGRLFMGGRKFGKGYNHRLRGGGGGGGWVGVGRQRIRVIFPSPKRKKKKKKTPHAKNQQAPRPPKIERLGEFSFGFTRSTLGVRPRHIPSTAME